MQRPLGEEWKRIWEDCEGLLCEKEVSSVAEGGKVKWRRREELEYSGSLQKLFSSFFFFLWLLPFRFL